MKYILVTMLAQIADDEPAPKVPDDWPDKSYWTADFFNNSELVNNVMKDAQVAMGRKITQDGMPGC
jgi:hypothetical protein